LKVVLTHISVFETYLLVKVMMVGIRVVEPADGGLGKDSAAVGTVEED
jgi:hypothetical protein